MTQLDHGVGQARSSDDNHVKTSIVERLKVFEGYDDLYSDNKDSRGFRNNLTGAFLCPVHLDWNDERYARQPCRGTVI